LLFCCATLNGLWRLASWNFFILRDLRHSLVFRCLSPSLLSYGVIQFRETIKNFGLWRFCLSLCHYLPVWTLASHSTLWAWDLLNEKVEQINSKKITATLIGGLFCLFGFFFCGNGIWAQGCLLVRQVLCHLRHGSSQWRGFEKIAHTVICMITLLMQSEMWQFGWGRNLVIKSFPWIRITSTTKASK
jgi:hypothetical protein